MKGFLSLKDKLKNKTTLKYFTVLAVATILIILSGIFYVDIAKIHQSIVIKEIVKNYNKLLIESAKTGTTEPLKDILIQRQRDKLTHWIASWHDSNVYMDAQLEDIEFKQITISDDVANVVTSEKWSYDYKNLKTKQQVLPVARIHYDMEYILQKTDKQTNKWVIKDIKIIAEKKQEN